MSSSNTRCAACKYLRRRCEEDCILAPYFPPQQPERFTCIHKIYGAGNIARTLQHIPVEQRKQAVESMVIEAYARVQNPVYGIAGTIHNLLQQIQNYELEIACTHAQIDVCASSSSLPNRHHLPYHHHINQVHGEFAAVPIGHNSIIGSSGSAGFAYLQEQTGQSFLDLPPQFSEDM